MSEKVFVSGLRGKAWTVSRVRDAFIPFGPVQDVTLGSKEGVAFVLFKFAADAKEAVENMDGAEIDNAYIRVETAKAPGDTSALSELRVNSREAVWGRKAIDGEEEE